MLPSSNAVNDIDIQIHAHRVEMLKDALARTVLLMAVAWFAHLIFTVWMGGFWVNPIGTHLFTAGVTILVALGLYVPIWRIHIRTMRHLKETKRRLKITVTAPRPH